MRPSAGPGCDVRGESVSLLTVNFLTLMAKGERYKQPAALAR